MAHLIAFLNYSHCSIPFLKVLGAFKKKRPSGVGGNDGAGARWMHIILMSLHSECYVCGDLSGPFNYFLPSKA